MILLLFYRLAVWIAREIDLHIQYIDRSQTYKHAETKMKSTQAHKTCYILHTCNSEQASHVPHSMYTVHGDAKSGQKWNHDKDNAKLSTYSTSRYDTSRTIWHTHTHTHLYSHGYTYGSTSHPKIRKHSWTFTSENFNIMHPYPYRPWNCVL